MQLVLAMNIQCDYNAKEIPTIWMQYSVFLIYLVFFVHRVRVCIIPRLKIYVHTTLFVHMVSLFWYYGTFLKILHQCYMHILKCFWMHIQLRTHCEFTSPHVFVQFVLIFSLYSNQNNLFFTQSDHLKILVRRKVM